MINFFNMAFAFFPPLVRFVLAGFIAIIVLFAIVRLVAKILEAIPFL